MVDTIDRDIDKLIEIAKAIDACGGKTYFIGGFVRDKLMGLPNKDVDVEVHGVPVDVLRNLLEQFGEVITIGKSFGIYSIRGYDIDIAVPRKEKNTGRGHRDFEIYTDPFLGVETAARRRDFTINAMMQDVLTGEIVDCFGGQDDLEKGVLRHIDADSFVEDPLRVLRAAQFAARFEYEVADETVDLCRTIDLSALPSERVEGELRKALCKGRKPSLFFETLRKMNQLDCWFPELASLIGLQQDPVFHPEGDVWTHVMTVLDKAAAYRDQASEPFRFMLVPLVHDLGKIETTEVVNGRIHSYQHEKVGVPIAECFVRRITNDTSIIRYVKNMTELHMRPNMVAYSKSSVKANHAARIVRGVHIRPVLEVGGVPVALSVGDEQEIVVLVDEDDGFAAPVCPFLADDDVQRIAEGVPRLGKGADTQEERRGRGEESFGFHQIDG